MIYYDSSRWTSLIRIHGSVLPSAMLWALPSAIAAYLIEWGAQENYINIEALEVLGQNNIYSGFTYVLGVSLVFRTSQAYSRYWTAATSIHEMASEWSDACASIMSFAVASKSTQAEIHNFQHTLVRLFSLLHAMAMSEVARVEDDLPLIDANGLSRKSLELLTSSHAQGRKVHIVLSWIKSHITRHVSSGLLNVPAPLLSHVFQELGTGLVKFHMAQQVVIWPFPFPYTQLNVLLIQIYTIITPMVISTWKTWPIICALFTFISVTFLVGLNLIAAEIENPFGDDPNDLPVMQLQKDVNNLLAMQLDPLVQTPPELLPGHIHCHKELTTKKCIHNLSLNQRLEKNSASTFSLRASLKGMMRRDHLRAQVLVETPSDNDLHHQPPLKRVGSWLLGKAEPLRRISRTSSSGRSVQSSMPMQSLDAVRVSEEEEEDEGSERSGKEEEPAAAKDEEASQAGDADRSGSSECDEVESLEEPGTTFETQAIEEPEATYALTSMSSFAVEPQYRDPQVSLYKDFLSGLREELSLHLRDFISGLQGELCEHLGRQLERFDALAGYTSAWDVEEEEAEPPCAAKSPPLTQHAPLLRQPSRT